MDKKLYWTFSWPFYYYQYLTTTYAKWPILKCLSFKFKIDRNKKNKNKISISFLFLYLRCDFEMVKTCWSQIFYKINKRFERRNLKNIFCNWLMLGLSINTKLESSSTKIRRFLRCRNSIRRIRWRWGRLPSSLDLRRARSSPFWRSLWRAASLLKILLLHINIVAEKFYLCMSASLQKRFTFVPYLSNVAEKLFFVN